VELPGLRALDESKRFAVFVIAVVLATEEGAGCWYGDTGHEYDGAGGVGEDGG
jgi:hypothetical protein